MKKTTDNTIHQIDCHESLSQRDKDYLFEVAREALADHGHSDPETIGFTLTAYCTTPDPEP